jgi:superoxide reductase
MKYFLCNVCGNLVGLINEGGGKLVCCGEPMTELVPKTIDAGSEKHVPVVTVEGSKVTVKVGSIEHPMTEEHHIDWISIYYNETIQVVKLDPVSKPEATFEVSGNIGTIEVYSYCNIHGLWKSEYTII